MIGVRTRLGAAPSGSTPEPNRASESPSARSAAWLSRFKCSEKPASKKLMVGRSSTSSQIIGCFEVLPWSCAAQLAVMTKSPRRITVFSPSTAV